MPSYEWHIYVQHFMNIALLDNPPPLLPFFARFPFPCVINHPFPYLEIPFLVIVVRMSIHTRPWLVIDCSPLAPYPPPPLPTAPTVHVTCFQRRHHNISYIVWHSSSILVLFLIPSLTYFKKEKKMVLGPFGRENTKSTIYMRKKKTLLFSLRIQLPAQQCMIDPQF